MPNRHGPGILCPLWPKPNNVRAVITTRSHPGASVGPYAQFNLAEHVGDCALSVGVHREQLADEVKAALYWLRQTHSVNIACLDQPGEPRSGADYDGSYTRRTQVACVVMTADCLPVWLCDRGGRQVMALHAGWRGLAAGILSRGVSLFPAGSELLAYLGPAISAAHFEVGAEVREAFLAAAKQRPYAGSLTQAFTPSAQRPKKYFADLYRLARLELYGAGVGAVYGGEYCTYSQRQLFYSYRRDGDTGRFASLIWRSH